MTLQFLVYSRSREHLAPVLDALHAAGVDFDCTWAALPANLTRALGERRIDLVLCEEGTPPGVDAVIRVVHERRPGLPVVVLSTQATPEMAVDAIRTGAADYLAIDAPERAAEAIRKLTAHVHEDAGATGDEHSLRAERDILVRLIDSAMDAIIALDEEQRVFLFNRAAEDLFGLPAERARGVPVREFLPGVPQRLSSTDVPEFSGAPHDRQPSTLLPLTAVHASGQELPVEAAISRTRVEGRQVLSIVIRDLTERKRLEAELLQAQKMEAIGRLAGGVAHDFNNLLTAIFGYSELALLEADDPGRIEVNVAEIKAAAERASALTRQLLALCRRSMSTPAPLDLNMVVHDMERMLHRIIGRNYELRVYAAEGLWSVRADRGQVEQVLLNLVVNAQDAMPYGGTIHIATENVRVDFGSLAVDPGPYVVLSVRDEGVGMDEDTQRRIFEPFFTTKEAGRGTGLGLAIVKGVVEQSGGTITVESEPSNGSTFCVYLPRADSEAEVRGDDERVEAEGGNETLLLLEADPSVRQLEEQFLEQQGYSVLTAENPDEAAELLRRHRQEIALFISNVVLLGMRGPQFTTALREVVPDLKVLFLAGYTDETLLSEVRHVGGRLLEKPFGSVELARAVRSALDA